MEIVGSVQAQVRQILDALGVRHLHVIGFHILHSLLFLALEDHGSGGDVALDVILFCRKITRQVQNCIGFGLMVVAVRSTA